MFDGKAFGEEIVGIVRGHVSRELEPLRAENAELRRRLDAVELRQPLAGEKGDPGPAGIGLAGAMIDRSGVLILTLSDGRTHELGEVVGKDGRDGVNGADGARGADGRNGVDGTSADMEAISEQVRAIVADAVPALPPPAKGERGEPGERGESGEAGQPGERGADGIGVMGAAIDRDGELFLTLSDGTVRELGPVLGKDGLPGAPGRDGLDGFGFEDLSVEYDGERGFTLKFVRGERTKEFAFALPVMIDRGVYKEGQTYSAGDTVTWAGSVWIAQKETAAKPDTPDGGWRLSVKRGRDGKDKA
jgi:hypothetical protein